MTLSQSKTTKTEHVSPHTTCVLTRNHCKKSNIINNINKNNNGHGTNSISTSATTTTTPAATSASSSSTSSSAAAVQQTNSTKKSNCELLQDNTPSSTSDILSITRNLSELNDDNSNMSSTTENIIKVINNNNKIQSTEQKILVNSPLKKLHQASSSSGPSATVTTTTATSSSSSAAAASSTCEDGIINSNTLDIPQTVNNNIDNDKNTTTISPKKFNVTLTGGNATNNNNNNNNNQQNKSINGSNNAASSTSSNNHHHHTRCGTNPFSNHQRNSGGNGGGGNNNNSSSGSHHYLHTTTTFSLDKNEEFHFVKPPECPVFKPTEEEFKNPLAYISKIRPNAEKYGICKIVPPNSWTPPFTVDVDKLRFTPRVQRLNELEAKTRVKLNFLDQIAKFWELQGSSLKIPMVERKALDLYTLHRLVQEEGGMEQATKDRKWSKVAQRMGYPAGKSVGTILKGHYERILHPFDIFTSGKVNVDIKLETEVDDQDYKPHGIVSRQQITPPNETTARRSKRFANSGATCGLGTAIKEELKKEEKDIDDENLRGTEYRRLHFYGPGPKMAGYSARSCRSRMASGGVGAQQKFSAHKLAKEIDPLAKYICHICNRGDAEEAMLLCDGCDDSYHTFCLIPPLNDIPKGDWRCPKCVVEEVSKPQEAFGFEQASREYTLQQFGEMADQFKADYFNMSVHLVPTDLVEREFWRIVSSIDEDVTVEYGADLHTMDHGSGFPTKSSLYLLPGDQEYAESSWNLNNLPLLEESILGHINADISGMKVPWMYVGMCFATFCWHNEDHWSYSINYLHWGEPKTWYGVPGSRAESFEATMKSAAPELFQSQPDLLHQLVTIMNPNILMNSGVPVYRTDQHAGEFVITFPRAYHAGFNQGYNFAEAVNFAPADWMKMGRECINHYSTLRRFCVFSHDELVCKMALDPDRLNLGIATACYLDMAEMVDSEKKLRKSLLEWGVTQAEREPFELIPDDERQCESCKTTCFLSAVSCACTQNIVCLRHYTELCECPPEKHTLKYRYTLDELPLMLKKLKVKAESFENWLSKVRNVLDPNTTTTITLEELQELAQEAEDKKFPSSVLLERLNSAVLEAEKCVTVIQQLDINKMRTRTRNSSESAKYKLTLDELELFVQEIDNLCCIIQEGQSVRELQILGQEFVDSAKAQLSKSINKADEKCIEKLIEDGSSLCIELHEIKALKDRLIQVNFYNRVKTFHDSQEKKPVSEIQALLKEGLSITPDYYVEKQLVFLQEVIMAVEDWELVAAKCFESGTQHELPEIELLLGRAEEIQGVLPSQPALKDAVKKAKEWLTTVETLQANENYPYFHTLENVVNRGKNIPFQLEELKRMEEHLESAKSWKERTSRTFLKKQTSFTLMDVLSPRAEAVMIAAKLKKKPLEEQFTEDMGPVQMVNAFKNAEEKELREMRELRKANLEKNPLEDKYCICKRKFNGNMYQCQLCKDWFHYICIPPPKNTVRARPSNSVSPTGAPLVPPLNVREKDRETKYLCQSCMRSRRPRLETILSLLVSLQRLPIRLPEGEALQCLTERAMNWQDRARQAFATEDVASALAALSIISQKMNEGQQTRQDKPATNSNRKTKTTTRKRRPQVRTSDEEDVTSSEEETFEPIRDDVPSDTENSPSSPTKIEHAYSVPPPSASASLSPTFSKMTSGLSSPLHKSDMPLIQLNKEVKETLEDLMMEGDLLEVSLDETLHLWRILNAAKPSISDLAYIQYRYNLVPTSNSLLVNSIKKRKYDENAGPPSTKRVAKGSATSTTTSAEKNVQNKVKRGRKVKVTTKDAESTIASGNDAKKRKRGKKAQQEQLTVVAASTSDDDEECSASNCAKPSGREVDWVQCDGGCNQWFHMYCVGLDKHQIKPDDDYICKSCKKSSNSGGGGKNSSVTSSSSSDSPQSETQHRGKSPRCHEGVSSSTTTATTTTATSASTTAGAATTTISSTSAITTQQSTTVPSSSSSSTNNSCSTTTTSATTTATTTTVALTALSSSSSSSTSSPATNVTSITAATTASPSSININKNNKNSTSSVTLKT